MSFLLNVQKARISFLPKLLPIGRAFSTSTNLRIKQIHEIQNGKELVIRADILSSDRVPYLIENKNPSVCPVCASGLDIKHTDVLILSQFVRRDGCMLPRRVTGLCKKQQKRVGTLVTMAHKAGLMPNLKPDNSHKDPKKRYQWKQHNKYFDESTIKIK